MGCASAAILALVGSPAVATAQTDDFAPFTGMPPFDGQTFMTDWWWDFGGDTFTIPEPDTGFWVDWGEPATPPPPDETRGRRSAPRRLLSPFPIVRLSGVITTSGTRVVRLTVQAPRDSQVTVRCRGTSCPFRRTNRISTGRTVRVSRLERSLRAGTVIEVLVSRANRIGKYTRFVIRKGRAPKRKDLCLWPGASTGQACPM